MGNSLEPRRAGSCRTANCSVVASRWCWWRRSSRRHLLTKATGRLDPYVRVVAALINVGDGLTAAVRRQIPRRVGRNGERASPRRRTASRTTYISISIPTYAASIPASVTARVVPSNVFAVSSVQLVDRGPGPAIRAGAQDPRGHRAADGAVPDHDQQAARHPRRDRAAAARTRPWESWPPSTPPPRIARTELLTSGAQLNRLVDELDAIVATEPGPDDGLRADRRHARAASRPRRNWWTHCIRPYEPMQTLVQQRAQLTALIDGGVHTIGYDAHRVEQPHRPTGEDHRRAHARRGSSWRTPRNIGCPPSSS